MWQLVWIARWSVVATMFILSKLLIVQLLRLEQFYHLKACRIGCLLSLEACPLVISAGDRLGEKRIVTV